MGKTRGVFERPAKSGIWWCQYYVNGQRRREKVGLKSDAIMLYRKRKTDAMRSEKLPELRRSKTSFGTLIDGALAYAKEHNKSYRDYACKGELLREAFGTRAAADLTPDDFSAWVARRKVSGATGNRYRAFVSLCYREGIRRGLVTTNVASTMTRKRESAGRKRFLSRKEYAAVYAALAPEHRDAFQISIYTGMRLSEQFSLTWAQVDFRRQEIHLTRTKNGDDRTVPLNADVLATLKQRKRTCGGKSADKVFPTTAKTPDPTDWFVPALLACRITDCTWHNNRHTFCSWHAEIGTPLKTIQVLAGHKSISVTAQYSHLSPDATRVDVDRMLAGPRGTLVEFRRKAG